MNTINIHGREYVPVSERVKMAHASEDKLSITTELVQSEPVAIVKATVVTSKGTFTGYSASNPAKPLEKVSPIEIAETSAIGRCLGFAGFAIDDGIASADEVVKAQEPTLVTQPDPTDEFDSVEIKVAGPQSKRPGAKYRFDKVNKKFISWVDEQK